MWGVKMESDDSFFLKPGAMIISREPKSIHTVLGSCVSVCVWDYMNGVGGMNHFIYHHAMSNARSCRYGDVAVPYLIKVLIDAGGKMNHFKAHIVGGSQSLIPESIVGDQNIRIAKELMSYYGIPIETTDVGGTNFRKVVFHNLDGEIIIKKGEI